MGTLTKIVIIVFVIVAFSYLLLFCLMKMSSRNEKDCFKEFDEMVKEREEKENDTK